MSHHLTRPRSLGVLCLMLCTLFGPPSLYASETITPVITLKKNWVPYIALPGEASECELEADLMPTNVREEAYITAETWSWEVIEVKAPGLNEDYYYPLAWVEVVTPNARATIVRMKANTVEEPNTYRVTVKVTCTWVIGPNICSGSESVMRELSLEYLQMAVRWGADDDASDVVLAKEGTPSTVTRSVRVVSPNNDVTKDDVRLDCGSNYEDGITMTAQWSSNTEGTVTFGVVKDVNLLTAACWKMSSAEKRCSKEIRYVQGYYLRSEPWTLSVENGIEFAIPFARYETNMSDGEAAISATVWGQSAENVVETFSLTLRDGHVHLWGHTGNDKDVFETATQAERTVSLAPVITATIGGSTLAWQPAAQSVVVLRARPYLQLDAYGATHPVYGRGASPSFSNNFVTDVDNDIVGDGPTVNVSDMGHSVSPAMGNTGDMMQVTVGEPTGTTGKFPVTMQISEDAYFKNVTLGVGLTAGWQIPIGAYLEANGQIATNIKVPSKLVSATCDYLSAAFTDGLPGLLVAACAGKTSAPTTTFTVKIAAVDPAGKSVEKDAVVTSTEDADLTLQSAYGSKP